ncbi:peptidylprolyl isomerase [Pelotomaculum propionicicum]|uniref:Peptidyl-prolyl cis-trans isomerase n=1 Tax=Pelotomaculum propionicicum TaxID=258475 RepID=A0A4Y7RTA6_9FIRM|nr:peptidylprolyl isomerase [Pelotomaculum propionicicum]TEB11959.1 putative peptidyl-prolyl cis-trans isomerase [Pelotomaculum propionicicum]
MAEKTKNKKSNQSAKNSKSVKNVKNDKNTKNIKNAGGAQKGKSAAAKTSARSGASMFSDKKKRNIIFAAAAVIMIILAVSIAYWSTKKGVETAKTVTVQTAKGPIVFEVYPNKMPVTVANFEKLAGSNFYDGLTFHRVEDWVIQGGDPLGNGTGGPGWSIPLETNQDLKNVRGAVAMARSQDPNSAGSQFYILKKDASYLDGQYAVFGKVIKGMDVVDQIEKGDKMESVKIE